MPPIRILIADRSERLRAVVRDAVAEEPDLVAIEDGDSEVDVMLNAAAADVVVIGMTGGSLPVVAERLLDEYPDIGVVAIDIDPDQGVILQLRPQLTRIAELSPRALSAALRKATSRSAV
jgi:hypothetical protein